MIDLVASLSRMNPTPSLLGPLSFPAYSMTFPSCMVNLPCPSIQCSAIPKILMLSLVISLVMTCSFAVFAPLMFHVANTAFFRRWIPFLSILRPSGVALPETGFGATPSSSAAVFRLGPASPPVAWDGPRSLRVHSWPPYRDLCCALSSYALDQDNVMGGQVLSHVVGLESESPSPSLCLKRHTYKAAGGFVIIVSFS